MPHQINYEPFARLVLYLTITKCYKMFLFNVLSRKLEFKYGRVSTCTSRQDQVKMRVDKNCRNTKKTVNPHSGIKLSGMFFKTFFVSRRVM